MRESRRGPRLTLMLRLGAGLSADLRCAEASFGINYLFEPRSLGLFLTNGARRDDARRIPYCGEQPSKIRAQ